MKIILFLFFIGNSSSIFAQEEKSILGKIIVKDAMTSGVTILNINTEKETQSDSLGNFKILAKVDDVLIFYAPHLDKMRKLIDEDAYKSPIIKIEMTSKITELDEVVIKNYSHINAYDLGITSTRIKTLTPAERGKYSSEPRALEFEESLWAMAELEELFDEQFFEEKLKIEKVMKKGFLFYAVENKSFITVLRGKNKALKTFYIIMLAKKYNDLQKQ